MTTIAAPSANQVQSTLTAAFTRGTSTTLVLTDGSLFPSPTPLGHVIYVHNADESKWCLIIYTSRATNTLTMGGGAADYALAKNVSIGDEAYEFPIGSVVELVTAADEIAKLFAGKIDEDGTVPLTADWDIGDGRYIAADKIRARDGDGLLLEDDGGKGIAIADGGIITTVYNSCARAYQGTATQVIKTGVATAVVLDAELFDQAGEMDVRSYTGAADATEAFKLHDADGGFPADSVTAGGIVWNTTDNTYASVSGFVDSGELTLDTDIMSDTDGYVLYFSRFTATKNGRYLLNSTVTFAALADAVAVQLIFKVNGVTKAFQELKSSAAGRVVVSCTSVVTLTPGDFVQLYAQQSDAGDESMTQGAIYTWLAVTKVA